MPAIGMHGSQGLYPDGSDRKYISLLTHRANARMRITLNRIAVTNPSTDKITPNMQAAQTRAGLTIIEQSHS